mgnify:CR=1 FL=1
MKKINGLKHFLITFKEFNNFINIGKIHLKSNLNNTKLVPPRVFGLNDLNN